MNLNQNHILIHYGEIALKGGNRAFFEKKLIENIKSQLNIFCPASFEFVKKMYGGILVKLNENGSNNLPLIEEALKHTPGIANYSIANKVDDDLESLKKIAWDLIKNENFTTFRVTTRRSNKNHTLTSEQFNREIGGYIFEKFEEKKKVSLKNADAEIHITLLEKFALVTLKKNAGMGGMPIGTGGKAMAMLSGGFDSPVAAFQILRRGVNMRYAHFHSAPFTSQASIEKVQELAKTLGKFGANTKLYLIPFADVQKEIMMKTPEKLRVILYRRMMVRIAEVLARREKCLALVTGDSIGQVASQTLENILSVNSVATIPIFRPLIGMDKEEIMQKAKDIGTYEISIMPHDDCCTRLMPKKPETRSKIEEVLEAEKALDVERLIKETLSKIEIIKAQ